MRKFIAAAFIAAMAAYAMPAHAAHCPADMKKIDAALASKPDLPKKTLAKVMGLRKKGEALHKAGQHGKSVETLGEAMKLLGIQ